MFIKADINKISKLIPMIVVRITIFILLLYMVILAFAYFNQEKLLFYPKPANQQAAEAYKSEAESVEDINIRTSDNSTLNGWLVKNASTEKSPLIIYFGGNADEISYMIAEAKKTDGWAWALINYRGYGQSTGSPNEENLFKDSLAIYDYFSKRNDINNTKIVTFGRSLGTGVAIFLAEKRQVEGIILATPYDSITSVAQESYPFLPVRMFLKNKFDSLSRTSNIKEPVLILAAENDEVIPISHAQKLADALGSKCLYKVLPVTTHETIINNPLYFEYINQFLKQF